MTEALSGLKIIDASNSVGGGAVTRPSLAFPARNSAMLVPTPPGS
jgi:hypothetical protein